MTKEEWKKELNLRARELMKLMNDPDNTHPHMKVEVTATSYVWYEGKLGSGQIMDYVND